MKMWVVSDNGGQPIYTLEFLPTPLLLELLEAAAGEQARRLEAREEASVVPPRDYTAEIDVLETERRRIQGRITELHWTKMVMEATHGPGP